MNFFKKIKNFLESKETKDKIEDIKSKSEIAIKDTAKKVSEAAHDLKEDANKKYEVYKEKKNAVKDDIEDKADKIEDQIEDFVEDVVEDIKDKTSKVEGQLSEFADKIEDQVEDFVESLEDKVKNVTSKSDVIKDDKKDDEDIEDVVIDTPLSELGLAPVALKALTERGFKTRSELVKLSNEELMEIKGVGKAAVAKIKG